MGVPAVTGPPGAVSRGLGQQPRAGAAAGWGEPRAEGRGRKAAAGREQTELRTWQRTPWLVC
jgi:hypothetical protein